MEMKLPDVFYMLGVTFYSGIVVVVAEIYERRLTSRQKGRIYLKDIALIVLGGFFWIVVLPADFLLNQICWKYNKNK